MRRVREILRLAVGEKPALPEPVPIGKTADPIAYPVAQCRFRVLHAGDELRWALDFNSDRWVVFLHSAQRVLMERRYAGPARHRLEVAMVTSSSTPTGGRVAKGCGAQIRHAE